MQVSYFEIYLDKIRDLLDGRIHFFISNYKLHIVSTILVALLNKHSIKFTINTNCSRMLQVFLFLVFDWSQKVYGGLTSLHICPWQTLLVCHTKTPNYWKWTELWLCRLCFVYFRLFTCALSSGWFFVMFSFALIGHNGSFDLL